MVELCIVGSLVLIGLWLLGRQPGQRPVPVGSGAPVPPPSQPEATASPVDPALTAARRRLLGITLGDHRIAERLVRDERLRSPRADEVALIEAACERWQRDNERW